MPRTVFPFDAALNVSAPKRPDRKKFLVWPLFVALLWKLEACALNPGATNVLAGRRVVNNLICNIEVKAKEVRGIGASLKNFVSGFYRAARKRNTSMTEWLRHVTGSVFFREHSRSIITNKIPTITLV